MTWAIWVGVLVSLIFFSILAKLAIFSVMLPLLGTFSIAL